MTISIRHVPVTAEWVGITSALNLGAGRQTSHGRVALRHRLIVWSCLTG
jgi:hypothetical protein